MNYKYVGAGNHDKADQNDTLVAGQYAISSLSSKWAWASGIRAQFPHSWYSDQHWWAADQGGESASEDTALPQPKSVGSFLVRTTQLLLLSSKERTILWEMPCDTWSWKSRQWCMLNDNLYLGANSIYLSPEVEFCGYSIPHPSEAKMNVRIQTYGN